MKPEICCIWWCEVLTQHAYLPNNRGFLNTSLCGLIQYQTGVITNATDL